MTALTGADVARILGDKVSDMDAEAISRLAESLSSDPEEDETPYWWDASHPGGGGVYQGGAQPTSGAYRLVPYLSNAVRAIARGEAPLMYPGFVYGENPLMSQELHRMLPQLQEEQY